MGQIIPVGVCGLVHFKDTSLRLGEKHLKKPNTLRHLDLENWPHSRRENLSHLEGIYHGIDCVWEIVYLQLCICTTSLFNKVIFLILIDKCNVTRE